MWIRSEAWEAAHSGMSQAEILGMVSPVSGPYHFTYQGCSGIFKEQSEIVQEKGKTSLFAYI